jgi:hypothetical protein
MVVDGVQQRRSPAGKRRIRVSPGRILGSMGMVAAAVALGLPAGAIAQGIPTLQSSPPVHTQRVIIRRRPVVIQPSPIPSTIIIVPPHQRPETTQIRVELDAQGSDWGTVYLNGRVVHQPGNFDRRRTLYLPPGGYRLEVTGVVRSDRWASGYLDLGRDNSRIVVVRFSKTEGVTVSGSPYVWIPD